MKFFRQKENPYLSDPHVRLMLDFQAGSKPAFDALMQTYYPRVLNFIYRFLANREIAEDLTQDLNFPSFKRQKPGYAH